MVNCRICKEPINCPPNHEARRNVCPIGARHVALRKAGRRCDCCACVRNRQRKADPVEIMTRTEMKTFLHTAKETHEGAYLGFRLAINGMLRLSELHEVRAEHFVNAKPCRLLVPTSHGSRSNIVASVDLDCETVDALAVWLGTKFTGRIFRFSRRTLQRTFKACLKVGNLYDYTFNVLRATGIAIRAEAIRTAADFEALRLAARFSTVDSLKRYLAQLETLKPKGEMKPLVDRVAFAK